MCRVMAKSKATGLERVLANERSKFPKKHCQVGIVGSFRAKWRSKRPKKSNSAFVASPKYMEDSPPNAPVHLKHDGVDSAPEAKYVDRMNPAFPGEQTWTLYFGKPSPAGKHPKIAGNVMESLNTTSTVLIVSPAVDSVTAIVQR
jgi:hypothetical protein